MSQCQSTNDAWQLEHCSEVAMRPAAPFHFDGTVHKPSYFPTGDTCWLPGTLWLTHRRGDELYGLRLQNAGRLERPMVRLAIFAGHRLLTPEIEALAADVRYLFDLDLDLAPLNAILEQDEMMRPVVERWRGARIQVGPLYESLMIYVVLQNATVRRSVQMMDNLFRTYGRRLQFDGQSLYGYWTPHTLDAASEEELRGLKMGYRAKSLKRLSAQFARGEIDEAALRTLPSAELKRELLKLYGIGPASVWYLMFGNFHRYDAFEYISPWEQKIFSRLLFDAELVPAAQILAEVDRRWGPWKMLAAHYLFEDLFWQHKQEPIPWLRDLIRL